MANSTCPVCGAFVSPNEELVNHLSDGTIVCEKCAARTRFLYHVGVDTEKKSSKGTFVNGEYDTDSYTTYESVHLINPVESMTLEEFKQALEETDRARAGDYIVKGR